MDQNTRVLVLGRSGMLGQTVFNYLSSQKACDVDATHRQDDKDPLFLDVEKQPEGIGKILIEGDYQFVINSVGVLKPEIIKTDPNKILRAIRVNAIWPHILAQKAQETGTSVIHMSTDGVFSGHCVEPYNEDCAIDCGDAYGQSKALGESGAENVLNIRCSIIGPDSINKRGLFEWFRSLPDESQINGYDDHIWNGVTTLQFAQLCEHLIRRDVFKIVRKESSIHHFCPNFSITKYNLLCLFAKMTEKRIVIKKTASPSGGLHRTLSTKFSKIQTLFPNRDNWEDVIYKMGL